MMHIRVRHMKKIFEAYSNMRIGLAENLAFSKIPF